MFIFHDANDAYIKHWLLESSMTNPWALQDPGKNWHSWTRIQCGCSQQSSIFGIKLHIPYAPCMVYLPKCGLFLQQMLVNIPAPWSIWVCYGRFSVANVWFLFVVRPSGLFWIHCHTAVCHHILLHPDCYKWETESPIMSKHIGCFSHISHMLGDYIQDQIPVQLKWLPSVLSARPSTKIQQQLNPLKFISKKQT